MTERRRGAKEAVILPLGVALFLGFGVQIAGAQESGEQLFESLCVACHSTGTERVLGPGLRGVKERRDHDWLVRKITEPDRLRAEEDSISLALLSEYETPMPNLGLSRDQAEAILDYLGNTDETRSSEGSSESTTDAPGFTQEQVELGRALFQGARRLESRAASCSVCHDVPGEGVVGGGSLGVSLADAYGRLGYGGMKSVIQNPPFPVMRRVYEDRPVNDEEAEALLAFFQWTGEGGEAAEREGPSYGTLLAGAGLLGALLLAGLFSLAWRGRRRGPVKEAMFERQIKTR